MQHRAKLTGLFLTVFFVAACSRSPEPPRAGSDEGAEKGSETPSAAEARPGEVGAMKSKAPPARGKPAPARALFGDLHLHTSLSPDAFLMGTRTLPDDSYRFAKGEEVTYLGKKVRRKAPLDFLAVTDHSEYLGALRATLDPNNPLARTQIGKDFNTKDPKVRDKTFAAFGRSLALNEPIAEINSPQLLASGWQQLQTAAQEHNEPGRFTTFVAYEWTSAPPRKVDGGGQNLHRCVIFGTDKVPELPFSSFDSQDPEKLWAYLEKARAEGMEVIAIPHNGNASNGLMFADNTFEGAPLTRAYAERRMQNEPVTEIIQGKGQSETHPALSPDDDFADFELWETLVGGPGRANFQKGSYVRQAFGKGQELAETLGANPFKYGLVGGTDYHSGVSSTEENNYPGSHGTADGNQKQALKEKSSMSGEPPITIGAAGLTGVWASDNTRESIFDALRRKETFGTSGNRLAVRLFASFDYPMDITLHENWVDAAYAGGVPMGSDLPAAPSGRRPRFIVFAQKDPNAANLDRAQIVKLVTKNGKTTEQIIDVLWSGERKPGPDGKVPAVGTTVDMKTATYTNTIGAPELLGTWEDAAFDPEARATYYVRVLEIPTPRWSLIAAVRAKVPVNEKMPPIIQERAYTSPVWYTPAQH